MSFFKTSPGGSHAHYGIKNHCFRKSILLSQTWGLTSPHLDLQLAKTTCLDPLP